MDRDFSKLSCPVRADGNVDCRCLGDKCAWFVVVSDPTIVGRGKVYYGCAVAVDVLLKRALNW